MTVMLTPTLAKAVDTVPLYGKYETTINYATITGSSHSFSNPFYGVDLNATFTSPSGKKITWYGFFDGNGAGSQTGNIWKIRFMPTELGTWTYTWSFSTGGVSGSGSFKAISTGAKPGPLVKDSSVPQWFATADGSKHVFTNMIYRGGYPAKSYDNATSAVNEAKNYGFDIVFASGGAHWYWRDSRTMNSNNPYQFMDTTNYVPRLAGWHRAEDTLYQAAYDGGVYIFEFLGFYAGNNLYNLHNKTIDFQNKVIKYWLARTAPYYNMMYNIGFEMAEYVSVPSWPTSRAKYVLGIDPWDHPVTAHELNDSRDYFNYDYQPEIDFSTLQIHDRSVYHEEALKVWNTTAKPNVHCNECIWNGLSDRNATEAQTRQDIWNGLTAGMSYGYLAIDSDVGLTAFKHANSFLKSGVKWWTMKPSDGLVGFGDAYVLAKAGSEYVIYSNSGSSFSISLASGSYKGKWFNPATGAFQTEKSYTGTGADLDFDKPSSSDWVLYLYKSSTSTATSTDTGTSTGTGSTGGTSTDTGERPAQPQGMSVISN